MKLVYFYIMQNFNLHNLHIYKYSFVKNNKIEKYNFHITKYSINIMIFTRNSNVDYNNKIKNII